MKTKLTDILDCLNTLRDYLEEAHQEELDSAHHGDESECSYCRAIAKADAILASSSSPYADPCGDSGDDVVSKPTVQEMRAALTMTLHLAHAAVSGYGIEGIEEAHGESEGAGLALCLKGGWDWEQAELPSGEALSDYCLKATSLECAEATLLAFEAWASLVEGGSLLTTKEEREMEAKRAKLFVEHTAMTPSEAGKLLGADFSENTATVHVCKATTWYIEELRDGDFMTSVANDGCLFSSMQEVIDWMRPRFFI